MAKGNSIDELNKFIDDTRQGMYSGEDFNVAKWQDIRYDFNIIEEVESTPNNVILYGFSG